MEFKARPYQELIIRKIIDCPRCCIYAAMGLGKTSSTLAAISQLKKKGLGKVLILAPLRVAASTWPAECEKWESLGLKCSPIIGTPKTRTEALLRDADVYTCNYEGIPWLVESMALYWRNFDMIVADESTRLKSFKLGGGGGVRAKALSKIAFKASRFVELTGTPTPNGLLDLWGQLYFIDLGARLGTSLTRYKDAFFTPKKVGRSPFAVQWIPLPGSDTAIMSAISDVSLSVQTERYFPVDTPVFSSIHVEMPDSAVAMYREACRDLVVTLQGGGEAVIPNAAILSQKCLQIASGCVYTESGWEEVHDAKIEALRSLVEECGEPLLVAYHWKADAERILKAFPKARLMDKSPKTIAEWNSGKIQMLLVHPQSAGHGLNLQDGGRVLVFFSQWWNLEERLQVIERIGPTRQMQSGHPRTVYVYDILAKGTLDTVCADRVSDKRSVQDALLEALEDCCE